MKTVKAIVITYMTLYNISSFAACDHDRILRTEGRRIEMVIDERHVIEKKLAAPIRNIEVCTYRPVIVPPNTTCKGQRYFLYSANGQLLNDMEELLRMELIIKLLSSAAQTIQSIKEGSKK